MNLLLELVVFSISLCGRCTLSENTEVPCLCTQEIQNLPTYTLEQVGQHGYNSSGIWVSYRSGVYDITSFIEKHPGGLETILTAAGSRLDMFWIALPVHMNERVYSILEKFRIGNLASIDRKTYNYNPFLLEKNRSHIMEVIAEEPYNAHAYPNDLSKSFITPNDLHYVRLHLPIPSIEIAEHTLTISGIGLKSTIVLSMNDIAKLFVKRLLNVTLQCSGNRRAEMNKVKLTHGVAYKHTAISTATWGGVWLLDVIKHFEINTQDPGFKYLNFEGADQDLSGMHYGTSIPKELALDPDVDLFLANEMNGVQIPLDHGYPLRLIAPGMAGFRSVKFLEKITFSQFQLTDVWEQRMYKFFHAQYYWDNIDYNSAPGLYYTNVQSAILTPTEGERIDITPNNSLIVMGYAFSGGGNGISRVDVSTDGGKIWVEATITTQNKSPPRRNWTWVFWQAVISQKLLSANNSSTLTILCRAFDTSYNSQPSDVRTIWNMMGVLVNHWHSVTVSLMNLMQ